MDTTCSPVEMGNVSMLVECVTSSVIVVMERMNTAVCFFNLQRRCNGCALFKVYLTRFKWLKCFGIVSIHVELLK